MASTYRLSLPDLGTMELMLKDPSRCAMNHVPPSDTDDVCLSGFSGSKRGLCLHSPQDMKTPGSKRFRRAPKHNKRSDAYKDILYNSILVGKEATNATKARVTGKHTKTKFPNNEIGADTSDFWWNPRKRPTNLDLNKSRDVKNNPVCKSAFDKNRNNIPNRNKLIFPKYKHTASIGEVEKANKVKPPLQCGDTDECLTMNTFPTLPSIDKQTPEDGLDVVNLNKSMSYCPIKEMEFMGTESENNEVNNNKAAGMVSSNKNRVRSHDVNNTGFTEPLLLQPATAPIKTIIKCRSAYEQKLYNELFPKSQNIKGIEEVKGNLTTKPEPVSGRYALLASQSACCPCSSPIGHMISNTSVNSVELDKSSSLTVTSEVHDVGTPSPNVREVCFSTDNSPKLSELNNTSLDPDINSPKSSVFDLNEDVFPLERFASRMSVKIDHEELTAPANSPQLYEERKEIDYLINKNNDTRRTNKNRMSVITIGSSDAILCYDKNKRVISSKEQNSVQREPAWSHLDLNTSLLNKAKLAGASLGSGAVMNSGDYSQKQTVRPVDFSQLLEIERKPVFHRYNPPGRTGRASAANTPVRAGRARIVNTVGSRRYDGKVNVPPMLGLKVQREDRAPFAGADRNAERVGPTDIRNRRIEGRNTSVAEPNQPEPVLKSVLPPIYPSFADADENILARNRSKKCAKQIPENAERSGKMSFESFYKIHNSEHVCMYQKNDNLNTMRSNVNKTRCPPSESTGHHTGVCQELGHHVMMGHRQIQSHKQTMYLSDRTKMSQDSATDKNKLMDHDLKLNDDRRGSSQTTSKPYWTENSPKQPRRIVEMPKNELSVRGNATELPLLARPASRSEGDLLPSGGQDDVFHGEMWHPTRSRRSAGVAPSNRSACAGREGRRVPPDALVGSQCQAGDFGAEKTFHSQ